MRRSLSGVVALGMMLLATSLVYAAPAGTAATRKPSPKAARVAEVAVLGTTQGTIVIKFHNGDAPQTVANFKFFDVFQPVALLSGTRRGDQPARLQPLARPAGADTQKDPPRRVHAVVLSV